LGLPKFFDSRLFPGIPPCGVMIGLAYNAYGGSIMYIETAVTNLVKNKTVEESKDKEK
jgi:ATP-dependent Lon protease